MTLSVYPVQSDHGDVHMICVTRSNGDSVTVEDYRNVSRAVTGTDPDYIPYHWFAEEDR